MVETLDALVSTIVPRVVPGVALVVVDREKVVELKAWGHASIAAGTTMTVGTPCHWFSMTKLVTATTLVRLSDEGLVDLDEPLADYYPAWSQLVPSSRGARVTARHLLAHSAGLANPMPLRWVHAAGQSGPLLDSFTAEQLRRHPRLRGDPGSRARYSNLGYLVAGSVIQSLTGQRFDSVVRERVLDPLAMRNTGFADSDAADRPTGYQRRGTPMGVLLPLLVPRSILGAREDGFRALRPFLVDGAPYGGLVGSATDAARFLRAHLRDGELDGTRILRSTSAQAMRTLTTSGRSLRVGLGWFRRYDRSGEVFVEHLGGGAGFWSCMRLYPRDGLGVVVMGNATRFDHNTLASTAAAAHGS